VARLAAYLDILADWNHRVNLTAAHTPEGRVNLLVAAILPSVRVPDPGALVDVGSGNGSPGLVMAMIRDDLEVTLLEPRTRRWAFLREAVRRCRQGRVRVERVRHDQFTGHPARTVTLRALSLPLHELAPLVAPGGQVLVFGGSTCLEGPFEEAHDAEIGGRIRVFRRLARGVSRGTPPVT
jgi:16S rRNA (guanine527-N7)-methyltransferase